MADSVVLLDFWASVFGMRVRIALDEKGVEFEYKEENLADKSPLLLQSNPVHKKIPVLIHNGMPICESLIVVQYIDEVWADKSPLLPKDPLERANARFWADYIDKKASMYPSGIGLLKSKGEAVEEAKKEFLECLKVLEGELKNKAYFGGHTFGFVDVALVPFSSWFPIYKTIGYCDVEVECPKLMEWVNRCVERESVSKHLPHPQKLYEMFESRRKELEKQ
ncbi:hypothetical protein ACLOJK_021518 [Asimina triloba]